MSRWKPNTAMQVVLAALDAPRSLYELKKDIGCSQTTINAMVKRGIIALESTTRTTNRGNTWPDWIVARVPDEKIEETRQAYAEECRHQREASEHRWREMAVERERERLRPQQSAQIIPFGNPPTIH